MARKQLPILAKKEIQGLDSKSLFAASFDTYMDEVWAEREKRLQQWAKEKRSQRWIAEETGRHRSTIGDWQVRFGIESSQPKRKSGGQPATSPTGPNPYEGYTKEQAVAEFQKLMGDDKPYVDPRPEREVHIPDFAITAEGLRDDLREFLDQLNSEETKGYREELLALADAFAEASEAINTILRRENRGKKRPIQLDDYRHKGRVAK
jgi:hypothetical protein